MVAKRYGSRIAAGSLCALSLLCVVACGGSGAGPQALTAPTVRPLLLDAEAPEVPDVVPKLLSLRCNGEWMGFHLGDGPEPTASFDDETNEVIGSHWQAVTRFEVQGVPWLALSIDADDPPEPEPVPEPVVLDPAPVAVEEGQHVAGIAFVEMASRGSDGERMRSNRLAVGTKTEDTEPPANDVLQSFLELPDTYQCPGGMQAIGELLLLANTNNEPDEGEDPLSFPDGHHGSTSVVQFIDVSDPTAPAVLAYELPVEIDIASHVDDLDTAAERSRIGTVGITQAADGHFFVAVMSVGGHHLHVYRSTAASYDDLLVDIQTALPGDGIFTAVDSWYHTEAPAGVTWPVAELVADVPTGVFQMASLLTQSIDGHICLLGGRNTDARDPFDGQGVDELRLYDLEVDVGAGTVSVLNPLVDAVRTPVMKDLALEAPGAGPHGSCNAGAGVYVSPTQELIVYVVEHTSTRLGPDADTFVRFSELRHAEVVRPDNPLKDASAVLGVPSGVDRDAIVLDEGETILFDAHGSTTSGLDGWVELFSEVDFGGRSLVLDLADASLEDWQDISLHDGPAGVGFDDVARSVRWYLPRKSRIQLFALSGYPALGERMVLPLPDDEFEGTPEAAAWIAMEVSTGFAGDVQEIADLSAFVLFEPSGGGLALTTTSAEDVTSSVRFDPSTEAATPEFDPHAWRLDPASPFGAVTTLDLGHTEVRFDAVDDDGSPDGAVVAVTLEVDDGFDAPTDTVDITILNVSPTLESLPDQEDQECPADILVGPVLFSDPGVLDTHTASVDWGDGSAEQDLGAVESGFEAMHLFDTPGIYTVTITVEDDDGGMDETSLSIEVVDTIAPDVMTDTQVDTLWSPNHKLLPVGFEYTVEDLCDPTPSIVVRVYSDEPEDGSPPKEPDVEMTDPPNMTLRPEREGKGDGRVYLIVVTGTDASDNTAFDTATVVVTHNQSAKAKADVEAQAAAAELFVRSNAGAVPAGFVEIGSYTLQ